MVEVSRYKSTVYMFVGGTLKFIKCLISGTVTVTHYCVLTVH